MITLEPLKNHPHHIPPLAEWMFEEWGQFYPRSSLEKTTRWVTKTARSDGLPITMLALDGNDLAGFAMVQRSELYRERGLSPWLGGLLVKKTYQNQGIGSQLHEWALLYAQSLGYQKLYLLAFDALVCEWYATKGWAILRTNETKSHPLIVMETRLPGATCQ